MRIRILTIITAVVLLFPSRPAAQVPISHRPLPGAVYAIVDRLLEHREQLSLTMEQVDDLAALSSRLRRDRGRLKIVGLDRVPGKSVPRYKRVYRTAADAHRMALRLLTPPQREKAEEFLATERVPR